jgi:PAS domain S-box-containing protein
MVVKDTEDLQQALHRCWRIYQNLFDAAPDAILLVNETGEIIDMNRQAISTFGFGPQELLGEQIEVLVPESYRLDHIQYRHRYQAQPTTRPMDSGMELYARRKDGTRFPVDIMLSPMDTGFDNMIICVIRDITHRKRLQDEMADLLDDLRASNRELLMAYEFTLHGWAKALELRDGKTEGHTQRVTEMTVHLARAVGVEEDRIGDIRRGALLHDIGKLGIPDSILLKSGPLTEEEWHIMRQHPRYAYELLSAIPYLRSALDIPYHHHEHWDGSGYPNGLQGEAIPLPARLFAVVDEWDALRTDRPYRRAWPEDKVRRYLRQQAGKHFDPQIVQQFLQIF